MGKLVEIIYSYGGDIIKFAGDAIICIFYSKKRLKESFRPNNASPVRDPTILKIDSNSDKSLPDSVIMPPSQLALIQIPSSSGGHKYDIDNSTEDTDLLADKSDRQSSVLASVSEIQPEIVLKAIRCALELRDVETQKLTVHVAMSCGKICFGILGGYVNRWECLISGQCIHQLSECLDDAPSKHAALTAECFEVLNVHSQKKNRKTKPRAGGGGGGDEDFRPENYDYLSQVQLQRLRSGNYMIISAESTDGFGTEYLSETPRSTPLPALVSQFVPVPISSGLEYTTGLSYLAEIREVTTMFMKV